MNRDISTKLFKQAEQILPGGVNSPVRSFKDIGETPIFIEKADGAEFIDADGNNFIDFCLSWGVHILGHNHPSIIEAVKKALDKGISYGTCCENEAKLADLVCSCYPSMDKIRFVNSGTEATMSAIRLARGYTKRDIIIKFDGCYHGHSDSLLVSAGSGVTQINEASSEGVPYDIIKNTISIPFNDIEMVKEVFANNKDKIAAVILEPIPANMGVIIPKDGYLESLREITQQEGSLLIFDEVISGFRVAPGGAQKLYNIQPDLTCLGKIIGGGFPVGAFGGKAEIMNLLAPNGPVYQAGTLSGNPIAMAAGLAAISTLIKPETQQLIQENSNHFIKQLTENLPAETTLNHIGPMFTIFFSKQQPQCFEDVKKCDFERFREFYKYMLESGVYLSPSQYEANFISAVHDEDVVGGVIEWMKGFK